MSRSRFQQGLDELKQKLLLMGGLAEQAVNLAIQAYQNGDPQLCDRVVESEPLINRTEREIDELALNLLAMQQPMAVDLRYIFAVVKINADLERVGDQAVNIVDRVREMHRTTADTPVVDIPRMASLAGTMVRHALQSFLEGDAKLAQSVLERDDEVDNMKDEAFRAMERLLQQQPARAQEAIDALLIARNLERVADHATNIAEDVIFWVRGADVRHHALDSSD